jgi:hypothetical protein
LEYNRLEYEEVQEDAPHDIMRRFKTGTKYETLFMQHGVVARSLNPAPIETSGYIQAPTALYPTLQLALSDK